MSLRDSRCQVGTSRSPQTWRTHSHGIITIIGAILSWLQYAIPWQLPMTIRNQKTLKRMKCQLQTKNSCKRRKGKTPITPFWRNIRQNEKQTWIIFHGSHVRQDTNHGSARMLRVFHCQCQLCVLYCKSHQFSSVCVYAWLVYFSSLSTRSHRHAKGLHFVSDLWSNTVTQRIDPYNRISAI